MGDEKLGLIVDLILDDAAKAKALKGMKDIEKGIEAVGATSEKVSKEQADAEKKGLVAQKNMFDGTIYYITKEEDARNKAQLKIEQENAKAARIAEQQAAGDRARANAKKKFDAETARVAEENARIMAEANKVAPPGGGGPPPEPPDPEPAKKAAKEEADAVEEKARRIAAAENKITDAYHKEMDVVAKLRRKSEIMGRWGQALSIGGMAVVGGAFAMAQAEANRQKSSGGPVDATTTKWLEANLRIEKSTQRIAQTAERIILPYLQKASELAERASKYLESKPEVVKAILAAGATAAVIGSALYLLSKGVRVVTDIKSLVDEVNLALALDRLAVVIAASQKYGVTGGLIGPAAKGATMATGLAGAGIAATVATVVGIIVAGTALGLIGYAILTKIMPKAFPTKLGDIAAGGAAIAGRGMEKVAVAGGMDVDEAKRKTLVFTYLVGRAFGAIKEGDPAWKGVVDGAKKAAGALDDLSASEEALAETAKKNAEGWKIVRDLEQDNLDAERKYNTQRADILSDSARAVGDVNAKYGATTGKIKSGLAESIGKLTADFNKTNLDAEKQYQSERADIIKSGGEAIKQIQSDTQEQLRQLEEDYATQKADLMASRDAGGLVLAQREFEKQKERISEGGAREIAQKRQDMKVQLADLQQSHAEQRAERQAEYTQAIIDARAQAAQQMAEAAQARQQELAEIARARALQLYELQRSYNEERRQRIQAAYNSIKDIGGALEVERAYKLKYYGVMLTDVTTFMAKYQAALKAGIAVPSKAAGGYTNGGLTMLHPGEFVMSSATTRAAEGMIGNRLSQSSVVRGLSGGASVQLVDNRRFDSRIPLAERNAIRQESIEDAKILISEMLRER